MTFGKTVRHIVAAACTYPRTILAAILACAALAAAYAATHFAMTTNTVELISASVDWRRDETALNRAFPSNADVSVVIVDGATPELAEAGAARLLERLAADSQRIKSVRRPDGGDFFARNGLLFGSTDDVKKAMAALIEAQPLLGPLAADPSLRGIADSLGTVLTGVEAKQTSLDQIVRPMDALSTAVEAQAAGKPAHFSWIRLFADRPGALAAPTRRLLLVQPALDFQSIMPGVRGSDAVRAAAAALALDSAHGVSVRLTGAVPLADEEFASLADNISIVALIMLGAMLGTLWVATRSVKTVLAIFATIMIGLVITAGIGLAAVGQFNLISVAFIPLFVGLGVDFGIQLAVRFNAERGDGEPIADALGRAAEALGGPLTLAAGAVFLGFGAFLPTAYVGISELGIIAGLGMIVALLLTLTLLPALLTLVPPDMPTGEVALTSLAPASRWLEARRMWVLASFVVAMITSIITLPLVKFDFNPLHLRNPDGQAMAALADLLRDPLRTPNTIDVVTKDAGAAAALAAKLRALPEVVQTITIDSFVPADQEAKLAAIGDAQALLDFTINPFETKPAPTDAEAVAALADLAARLSTNGEAVGGPAGASAKRLANALSRLAQAPEAARSAATTLLVAPLGTMLDTVRASLLAEPVTRESLPPELARDWIAADGRARVAVFPRGDSNNNDVIARFTDAVSRLAPHATGLPVTAQRAAGTVAGAFVQAGLLALALVSLLLFAALRSIREVAFTLAPVVLSGFLTLGTCVLIGQPINFANIIAFPLLFGVGVAFHIYFVMAWRDGATGLLHSSLARGVLFSAIATGSAFGSLWLSSHPGTASMGKILMLSLAWTLVCALIFEPALLGPQPRTNKAR
ncbi:MAG: MMPL family transporter [Sphingomonadaceae bacterium]